MPDKNDRPTSAGVVLQPEPRIIENPPAASVAKALANSKAQVAKASK